MNAKERLTPGRKSQKVLLTLALIGAAVSFAGIGTYSLFTSTVTGGPQTISSGTVTIQIGATGAATNRLNVNASNIAPNDTIQRAFDLTNAGTIDFGSVTATTTASTSSVLDTDVTNGLQMTIDRCTAGAGWVEAGVSPAFTYTCPGGSIQSVVASRPVIGAAIAMSNLGILTHGATDHLRVTLTLPNGAGNSFQSKSSTISYQFDATQRAGTAQ
jgi:spore coat-associated protein N